MDVTRALYLDLADSSDTLLAKLARLVVSVEVAQIVAMYRAVWAPPENPKVYWEYQRGLLNVAALYGSDKPRNGQVGHHTLRERFPHRRPEWKTRQQSWYNKEESMYGLFEILRYLSFCTHHHCEASNGPTTDTVSTLGVNVPMLQSRREGTELLGYGRFIRKMTPLQHILPLFSNGIDLASTSGDLRFKRAVDGHSLGVRGGKQRVERSVADSSRVHIKRIFQSNAKQLFTKDASSSAPSIAIIGKDWVVKRATLRRLFAA